MKRIVAPWLLFAATVCPAGQPFAATPYATGHPRLLLGAEDVAALRDSWQQSELFRTAVDQAMADMEPHLRQLPDVPVPRDAGGGYSHERHKANGIVLAQAGALFQWTGNARYADLVRRLLLAYATLYPDLGAHPERKEQAPGRLFWQSLNESVWLVYAIQGYDAAYETMDVADRKTIETKLLRPMSRFLSVESPETFDRIHNHGTWATAAVGMTGYVLNEPRYVRMALLGTGEDGETGYLAQLRQLFSPDGYYMEGPYYQRYALMPFVLFAKAIERNEPERAIFDFRDGIIGKAIRTTIQLSYAGLFFPVNDAIRDKGLDTVELDHAIAIAYGASGDPALLSLVDDASNLVLTADALRFAQAREAGEEEPFPFASRHFRDGPAGDRGALTILRSGAAPGHSAALLKATSHGFSHGHFDRLHWMFYDNGGEVVTDYGAARFLNVEQKSGGRYLPENASWAKQSIAHNTIVVGGQSQFQGSATRADRSWPTQHFYQTSTYQASAYQASTYQASAHQTSPDVQIVSALEESAYEGTRLRRTLLLIEWSAVEFPFVLDVVRAGSTRPQRYDMPLYYKGHTIESVPPTTAATALHPLGESSGYQHLWMVGETALPAGSRLAHTWLRRGRFYTYTALANAPLRVTSTQVGANDPNFNLRSERGLMLRTEPIENLAVVGVLEPHGEYNGAREYTVRSRPLITDLQRFTGAGKDLVTIATASDQIAVALSYDANPNTAHTLETAAGAYRWHGYYRVFTRGGSATTDGADI